MASGDIKGVLAASSQLTITLASLATDPNLLVGRQSTEFDNTSTLYPNISVTGKITVGTSPTTAKEIRVYLIRPMKDGTYPDAFTATDAGRTITSVGTRDSCCKLIARIDTVGTSDLTYYFDSGNIAAIFGFSIVSKFVVFVTHSTAGSLHATAGNHEITVKGSYENVAP
tara:strand:+ start:1150 stop:1659 length:510 start_codon:yes stop_codon:yes gene_type:complete